MTPLRPLAPSHAHLDPAARSESIHSTPTYDEVMTVLARRRVRWAVPFVLASVMIAAVVLSGVSSAASARGPVLPARTPSELLASIASSQVVAMSGTVAENVSIGLPALPDSSTGGTSLSWQTLLTGSHAMRVWVDGPTRQRVVLLGQLSETDVIRNGLDVWTYDSQRQDVTHLLLPARSGASDSRAMTSYATPETPTAAATSLLELVGPTTSVTVGATMVVAGRSAYRLVVVPRDARTLIGRVEIAVDAQTSVPLAVDVYARGAKKPSIDVHFTQVSFAVPASSVFNFTPPPGSTVKNISTPTNPSGSGVRPVSPRSTMLPKVLGAGWTAVVELPRGGIASSSGALLAQLSTPVSAGHLITSSLLSVLITKDGRIFAGPVDGAELQQVVASGQGL